MKTLKKILRFLALIFLIALASVLPIPITYYRKDNMPKYTIEQIDKKDNDTENEDIKKLM